MQTAALGGELPLGFDIGQFDSFLIRVSLTIVRFDKGLFDSSNENVQAIALGRPR